MKQFMGILALLFAAAMGGVTVLFKSRASKDRSSNRRIKDVMTHTENSIDDDSKERIKELEEKIRSGKKGQEYGIRY